MAVKLRESSFEKSTKSYFSKEEKEVLLDLICSKQIHLILKNHKNYENKKYQILEELKVKIKDM